MNVFLKGTDGPEDVDIASDVHCREPFGMSDGITPSSPEASEIDNLTHDFGLAMVYDWRSDSPDPDVIDDSDLNDSFGPNYPDPQEIKDAHGDELEERLTPKKRR